MCKCGKYTGTQSCNICNQSCDPCNQDPCGCKFTVDAECVLNNNNEFCAIQVKAGGSQADINSWIDEYICKLEEFTVLIENIGGGVELYKGTAVGGIEQFKTFFDSDSVKVDGTQTNTVSFYVDEEWLNDFIEENQKTYSAVNIGNGVGIYAPPDTVLGDNTTFRFKTLTSPDIIIEETETEINLRVPSGVGLPNLIVNQDFQPTYNDFLQYYYNVYLPNGGTPLNTNDPFDYKGEGTTAKPFTDTRTFIFEQPLTPPVVTPKTSITNGVEYYIGTGDVFAPQRYNQRLYIQASAAAYEYEGDFTFATNSLTIGSGATIISNPINTPNGWLVDLERADYFPTSAASERILTRLYIESNVTIELKQNGFRNDGLNVATTNFQDAKILQIFGADTSVIGHYDETMANINSFKIFSLNENSLDRNNDGHALLDLRSCIIASRYQPILHIGRRVVDIINCQFTIMRIGIDILDPDIKYFNFKTGSYVRSRDNTYYIFGTVVTDRLKSLFYIDNLNGESTGYNTIFNDFNPVYNGVAENLVTVLLEENKDYDPQVRLRNSIYNDGIAVFDIIGVDTSNLGARLVASNKQYYRGSIFNCNFSQGDIDTEWVDLTGQNNQASSYITGRDLDAFPQSVKFLPRWVSKQAAQASGLGNPNFMEFIKYTTVTTGSFVVGEEYKISNVGDTDFTLIGATSNTVGEWFVATGVGGGTTGTADLERVEILS